MFLSITKYPKTFSSFYLYFTSHSTYPNIDSITIKFYTILIKLKIAESVSVSLRLFCSHGCDLLSAYPPEFFPQVITAGFVAILAGIPIAAEASKLHYRVIDFLQFINQNLLFYIIFFACFFVCQRKSHSFSS